MRRLSRFLPILLVLTLAACAGRPAQPRVELPPLRLAPATLGAELFVHQRLRFHGGGQERELEALLEVDAESVRLAVQALGRPGVRLYWDGTELRQQRADWLPEAVRGERVMDDLQFALWPAEAIVAVLPGDWSLHEGDGRRELRRGRRAWLSAERFPDGRLLLENRAEGYRLEIVSAAGEGK